MNKIRFYILPLVLIISNLIIISSTARGAATTSLLAGGVCINEILVNPKSSEVGFDTDGNGTPEDLDEFIELYNTSSSSIDISGWQLWDSLHGNWYSFPGVPDDSTTILPPGAYAVVIAKVQIGGSLPVMTNPSSLVFNAAISTPAMNNTSDNVVLYDPGADKYIQLLYNSDAPDDPTSSYPGFSATAVRVGVVEDFGADVDGKSLARYPSGDTNVVVHDAIPGAGNASPSKVQVASLHASTSTDTPRCSVFGISLFIVAGTSLLILQQRHRQR